MTDSERLATYDYANETRWPVEAFDSENPKAIRRRTLSEEEVSLNEQRFRLEAELVRIAAMEADFREQLRTTRLRLAEIERVQRARGRN